VNSLNKALLFLAAGLRGPLVGAAFAVGAFSVAGVPPTVGFLGKVALFESGLSAETVFRSVVLVVLIFLGSALSFVYSFQIYQRRFWAPGAGEPGASEDRGKPSAVAPRVLVLLLAALALAAGIFPEPLLYLSEAAADGLTGGP
jgi:multicomponent Na+:H+ antiporter subunit D